MTESKSEVIDYQIQKFKELLMNPLPQDIINYMNDGIITCFILKNGHDSQYFSKIQTLIDVLSLLAPRILSLTMWMLLGNGDERFLPVIDLFFKKNKHLDLLPCHRLIGNDDENVEVVKIHTLAAAILNYPAEKMACMIANYFPCHIAKILVSLRKIEKVTAKVYNEKPIRNYDLSPSEIKMRRITLLLNINREPNYQPSRDDKLELVDYFKNKIASADTREQLALITHEFKSCYLLGCRRHSNIDQIYQFFFNEVKEVSSVTDLLKAVKMKGESINEDVLCQDQRQEVVSLGS